MREFRLIVCVKQVPDPEGPSDAFKVDSKAKEVTPVGIPPLINPFDENALEVALRIKDHHQTRVVVVSMGEKLAQPVLRKALACGADDLVLLLDPLFRDLTSYSAAYVLSKAIKMMGSYDLVLTGRHASDWDFGVTGLYIAEMLGIPGVNLARKVEVQDNTLRVEKLGVGGYDIVQAPIPALVTVSNEAGELRIPNLKGILAASKMPIQVYTADGLGIGPGELETREIVELSKFEARRECYLVEGKSSEMLAENLIARMKKDGVI